MATTKTERLNALFKNWQKSAVNGFAKDGIIVESAWDAVPQKVLFLAKDTNDFSGDMRDHIRKNCSERKWHTLGLWAYGLQHVQDAKLPRFSEAFECSGAAIMACAFVNVKKRPGKSRADYEEIRQIPDEEWCFLKQEIEIIEPKVVVYCGTFEVADKRLFGNQNRPQGPVRIKHCHPLARYPQRMMYYGLVAAYGDSCCSSERGVDD